MGMRNRVLTTPSDDLPGDVLSPYRFPFQLPSYQHSLIYLVLIFFFNLLCPVGMQMHEPSRDLKVTFPLLNTMVALPSREETSHSAIKYFIILI